MELEYIERFMNKFDLSEEEKNVCRHLLCTDLNVKEMSDKLGKTESTIKNISSVVYKKINASNRIGLMMLYHQYLEEVIDTYGKRDKIVIPT